MKYGQLANSERAWVRASIKDAIECATAAHEIHNSEHTFRTCEAIKTAYSAVQIASGVLSKRASL